MIRLNLISDKGKTNVDLLGSDKESFQFVSLSCLERFLDWPKMKPGGKNTMKQLHLRLPTWMDSELCIGM